ncbi:hypothetical protein GFM13_13670 [Rhizobium leguminosarum bv. viciae]|uniref:hypothetical protein n=1 Tax=Rhizobium ruizarguesonis TaxID=2081791 RepID=UPI0014419E68|nr:hypothetical protein [Rhizobium ruizarguesonis]NKK71405.1 hypothetical protein [Rhizobium leguminosarum bv. viciae]
MMNNDNQPAFHPAIPPSLGKNDETVRGLCSQRALDLIEALPAVLRLDDLDTLERDAIEAAENYDRAIAAIDAYCNLPKEEQTGDLAAAVLRREYLARKSFDAYRGEIEIRKRELAKGIH